MELVLLANDTIDKLLPRTRLDWRQILADASRDS
jgi:hypothetical protein